MVKNYRLDTIDWLRGLVMIIMTLDHVRDYIHSSHQDPMSDPEAGGMLYFTRWITHLCAPTFVFLSGLSAGLMLKRKSKGEISKLLFTRGLWLIFLEVTVISLSWKFNFSNQPGIILQVIWAIGVSMIALSVLIYLPRLWILVIGVGIVAGSNLLDNVIPSASFSQPAPFWLAVHRQIFSMIGGVSVIVAYPVLAWIGIIACGFAAAEIFNYDSVKRQRVLFQLGIGMVVAFLIIRFTNFYGDPSPWQIGESWGQSVMNFFNVEKYPPSLLYSLVTLGIALLLLTLVERTTFPLHDQIVMFGRVPLFFYIAHLYLAHSLAIVAGMLQGLPASAWLVVVINKPAGYGYSLPVVYGVWIAVVLSLYPACHYFAKFKQRKRVWWTSYL